MAAQAILELCCCDRCASLMLHPPLSAPQAFPCNKPPHQSGQARQLPPKGKPLGDRTIQLPKSVKLEISHFTSARHTTIEAFPQTGEGAERSEADEGE